MAITDYITIAALLYFAQKGLRKGLMKTILGPISLFIGLLMGFVYYHNTKNLPISFLIGVIGPFALRFFASILLALWTKASNVKPSPSTLSRWLGCAFSIVWGGSYLVAFLILLGIAPLNYGGLKKIHADVTGSKSYALLNRSLGKKFPGSFSKITDVLQNPEKMEKYKSTEEFTTLVEDQRMQDLFSDKATTEQIKNKDYAKLLSNPKFQAIFKDEQLLKKIIALNKAILESDTNKKTSGTKASGGAKIIDVK